MAAEGLDDPEMMLMVAVSWRSSPVGWSMKSFTVLRL